MSTSHLAMGTPPALGPSMSSPSPVNGAYGGAASPIFVIDCAPAAAALPDAVPAPLVVVRSTPRSLSGAAALPAPLSPTRVTRAPLRSSPTWSNPPAFLDQTFFDRYDAEPVEHAVSFAKHPSWLAPLFAELLGTFMLVFGAGSIFATSSPAWAPTGLACLVMALVYVLAPVSGAHMNPAISLSSALSGKMTWSEFWSYIIAQILGGLLGGWLFIVVLAGRGATVQVAPATPFSWPQVFLVETLFTALLCFVYLSVMMSCRNNPDDDQNHFTGLAVGLVFIAGGYAATGITGGVFLNPALSMGLGLQSLSWPWAYISFELAGAFAGSMVFFACRREDYQGAEAARAGHPASGLSLSIEARLWGELFGTVVLAMTVGLCTLMSPGSVAWAAAAALMALTYSLGDVSGAHFNPVVTLAVVVSRQGNFCVWASLKYLAVHLFGAVLAGLLLASVNSALQLAKSGSQAAAAQPFGPPAGLMQRGDYIAVELLGMALLTYVFLAVATTALSSSMRQGLHAALATGGALVGLGCIASAMMGTVIFNPSVALALATTAFVGNSGLGLVPPLLSTLWFTLVDLLGGGVGLLLFCVVHVIRNPGVVQNKY